MPRLREVSGLRKLCISALADFMHGTFKARTAGGSKRRKSSNGYSQEIFRLRYHTAELLSSIPAALQSDLFDEIKIRLLSEKALLDQDYYKCAGCFWNDRTRKMVLDNPRFFQDSSMALEAFVGTVKSCNSLQEVCLTRNVVDLACFEIAPILRKFAVRTLERLTIQGLNQVDVDSEELQTFLRLLGQNCPKLQYLDLSDSALDNDCCELLSEQSGLRVLKMDQCPSVETAGATQLLLKLKNLVQFECGSHLHNLASKELFSAVEGMTDRLALETATFRQLHGLGHVGRAWPTIDNVRMIYNEYDTDACLDEALGELVSFPTANRLKLELEINGANLLLPIQFGSLSQSGRFLTKLTLTQCEFLHAQTLNPWASHCPSLASLHLYSCQMVSDDTFVGEVPALQPFANLRELVFEGRNLPGSMAEYLLHSSGQRLRKVGLHVTEGIFPSECLGVLLCNLEELRLTVERIRTEFSEMLRKLVEESPILTRLELLCSAECELGADLEDMEDMVRRRNWDLKFLYHVRQRSRQART